MTLGRKAFKHIVVKEDKSTACGCQRLAVYKILQYLHAKDDAKAKAIPWLFSENNQAKNAGNQIKYKVHHLNQN